MQDDPLSERSVTDDEVRTFLERLKRVTEELEAALHDAQTFTSVAHG